MTQKSKKKLKEFLSWLSIFLTILWVLLFLYGVLVEQKININLEKANGQIKTIEVTKQETAPEKTNEEPKIRLHDTVENQEKHLQEREEKPVEPEKTEEKPEEKTIETPPELEKIQEKVTINSREASLSGHTMRLG